MESRTEEREKQRDEIEAAFEALDGSLQTAFDTYRRRIEKLRTLEKDAIRAKHAVIAKQSSLNEQSQLVQTRHLARIQSCDPERDPESIYRNTSVSHLVSLLKSLKVVKETNSLSLTPLSYGLLSYRPGAKTIQVSLTEEDHKDESKSIRFSSFGHVGRTIESIQEAVQVYGTEGISKGQFRCPLGIAIHPQNMNIYVVEWDNYRVQVFDPQFQFLKSVGSLGKGEAQFDYPRGVTVSPEGRVAVTDHNNNRVQIFDSNLNYLFSIGKGNHKHEVSSKHGALQSPYSAIYDADGNLYVADKGGRQIQKYNHDGEYIQSIGNSGDVLVKDVESIAVLSNGDLCSASCSCDELVVFTPDGQFVRSFDIERLSSHVSICNGYDDSVFVSDFEKNFIAIYDREGHLVKKIGESHPESMRFRNPRGLTFGPDNKLYVCDYRNNRVHIF